MNRLLRRLTPAALCAGLVIAGGSIVQTNVASGQQKKTSDGGVKQLIKQLEDDRFDKRREAREKLFELGEKAVPALTQTALDKTKETGYSAVRILSRMVKETTGKPAETAKAALQKIAKGDDAMARQARESLEEAETQRRAPQRGGLRGMPLAGGGRSSQTSVINGVVNTTVREPGRTVQIKKQPTGEVSITVTDEGQKPKTWSAKSEDELKKKHPDGFKLFQQYDQNNVRIGIGIGGIPQDMFDMLGRDPFGGRDPFDPFNRRRRVAPRVQKDIQDAELLMEDMSELLKSLKKKTKEPEVDRLERKLESLKRSVDRIKANAGR